MDANRLPFEHPNGGVVEISPDDVGVTCPQTTDGKRRFLTLSELLSLEPPEKLIEGILFQGSFAVLYGAPGSAKTFIALDMTLSIAAGKAFLGHEVSSGAVIYIAGEGLGGLPKRALAWLKEHHDSADVAWDSNFQILGSALSLMDEAEPEILAEEIDSLGVKPKLIVLDTLARCMAGGDENSAQDMGRFVAACDYLRSQTGASILVVHHTVKAGESERGSSSLRGAADTMIFVSKAGDRVSLRCTKQKDAEEFENLDLALKTVDLGTNDDGKQESSCRIGLVECETQPGRSHAGFTRLGLKLGLTLRDDFGDEGASSTELEAASGIARSTYFRTIKALVKKGYVRREKKGNRIRFTVAPKLLSFLGPRSHDSLT